MEKRDAYLTNSPVFIPLFKKCPFKRNYVCLNPFITKQNLFQKRRPAGVW